MSNVDRVMLPQEFYDWNSDQLLIQPEPQYIFADLALRALGASLQVPESFGLPGREISYSGADYANPEAGRLFLEPDMLNTNLFGVKVDFNGKPGNTVRVNRPKYGTSTHTEASRRIMPGTSISTTGIRIESEQAILTLHRYGGPYGTSEIQPYVAEELPADMGVHDLNKLIGHHLVRDFHKTLDTFLVALGMQASVTKYPRGMSAANDATTAGSYPLTYETLSRVASYMDSQNLPVLPDGRRVLAVTPTGEKQLKDDAQFAKYAEKHVEKNPLFNRYTSLKYLLPEFYIFTSNTLDTTANNSNVNVHTALAMAPGCFGLGMGQRPRIRNNTNDNYGLSVPVIWTAVLGLANLDDRFTVKVSYSADVS